MLADSESDLQRMMDRLNMVSVNYNMKINTKKTRVLRVSKGSESDNEDSSCRQWRNHARAITGSARVGFISARAVARPENEQGVLCLSIMNQGVFRFKTAV